MLDILLTRVIAVLMLLVCSCTLLDDTYQNEIEKMLASNSMDSPAAVSNCSTAGVTFTILGNPVFVPGRNGNCILFTDYSQSIAVTLTNNIMSRGTIAFWLAPQFDSDGDGITEPAPTFFQTAPWNEFPNNHCMELVYQNNISASNYGKIAFNIYRPGTTQSKTTAVTPRLTFTSDAWMHLAAVWDIAGIKGSSDTMRVYLNGIMVAKTNEPFHESEKTYFELGNNLFYRSAHSKFDDLRIFSTPITDFDLRTE